MPECCSSRVGLGETTFVFLVAVRDGYGLHVNHFGRELLSLVTFPSRVGSLYWSRKGLWIIIEIALFV